MGLSFDHTIVIMIFVWLMEKVADKSEKVTLQNAIRTWAELRIFCNQLSLSPNKLTALPVASFIRQHKTRTRAINAVRWLVKNLRLSLDLSLVVAPSGPRKVSKFGEGARQAPVLPPALVTEVGRSLTFWCSKGKTLGTREGFLWSVPRHTPQHFDLWPVLETTLKEYGKMVDIPTKKLHWLAVDLDAGKPLGISGFVQCMQLWMQHCIDRPSSLSSYSFRRVAPTWAALAALLDDQKLGSTTEVEPVGWHQVLWFSDSLAGGQPA